MGSKPRNGKIILRLVKDLTLHPATELVPPATMDGTYGEMTPLEILRNKQILFGRAQYEQARSARRRQVPTVVIDEPDDAEMYVLRTALEAQFLTDDQRACLAVEYAARLSARMRRERAFRAAAVRYGRIASRTTWTKKQDARAEACASFRIPPKKFRQLRKLHAQHQPLYQQVLRGATTLKQARELVVQQRVADEEKNRSAAGPTLSPPELILGDARTIIPTLPDEHFTALMTDPPYGINFRQGWRGASEIAVVGDKDARQAVDLFRSVLIAADSKLRRQAFLLTFIPAKHEPQFREVVTTLDWTIIGHLIWVKNSRMLFPHLNVASQHERMILAVRGGAKLRKPISDVFRHGKTHASSHPCEKPVALLSGLIEAVSVKGEAVLDCFAGSGAAVVAARRLGRQAVGIEIEPRWHAEAVARLQKLKR